MKLSEAPQKIGALPLIGGLMPHPARSLSHLEYASHNPGDDHDGIACRIPDLRSATSVVGRTHLEDIS